MLIDKKTWLGKDANIKIQKLCFKLDDLCSVIYKTTGQLKRRFKKAANRIRAKLKNLVSELHKKSAKFLVDNFDVILLPTFETSQMAKKGKRRIRSKSVRQTLTLSHYQFKQLGASSFGRNALSVRRPIINILILNMVS